MLKIYTLVLVLQIGFNAALNNGGYNSNPLIPQSRSLRHGLSRRRWNINRYHPQISERIASSESDQSDSEQTNLEKNYQSQRSLNDLPYLRSNNLRYNARSINDASLEPLPVGRFEFNYRSDYSTKRADTDFRRPYLRHKLLNVKPVQNRKYRRKGDSNGSPVNGLATATAGEDANYLSSLLSLIEQPNPRRDQSRKYYREESDLSLEIIPDSLESDEESRWSSSRAADNQYLDSLLSSYESPNYRRTNKLLIDNANSRRSLQSNLQSTNYRRSNHKNNRYSDSNVRFEIPPATDYPDAYIDTVLLVSAEEKPSDRAIVRPQLRNSRGTKSKKHNRRYDDSSTFELSSDDRLSTDDDNLNELSAFRGIKTNLRYNNDNLGVELNDRLSLDDDDNDKIAVLSLASLEDLNLDSPQLRSRDHKQKNKHDIGRSFLRLALSPNEKLKSLDEDVALGLSELLSENLDNLKLVPISLKASKLSNLKNRKTYDDFKVDLSLDDKMSSEDDTLSDLSLDDSSFESPFRRYASPKKNWKSIKYDDSTILKLLLTNALKNKYPIDNLVPYHEFTLATNNKTQNNTWDENPDNTRRNDNEFNLPLLNEREDDNNDLEEDTTVLRLDTLSSEEISSKSSTEFNEHYTTDVLHLEFPWNDQLGLDDDQGNKHKSTNDSKSRVRNHDRTDQSNEQKDDVLKLEFPWNDQLTPDDKSAKDSTISGLRNREQIDKQSIDPKNYELELEFPWNDQLSPDDKKGKDLTKNGLRNIKQTDRQSVDPKNYELELEFPWNDQLSPDDKKGKGLTNKGLRNIEKTDRQSVDPKNYELNLEFPWNDQLSPDDKKGKDLTNKGLRNIDKTDRQSVDPKNYELNLEFPWNDQLSPDDKSGKNVNDSKLKNREHTDRHSTDPKNYELKLEFPWNGEPSLNNKSDKDLTNHGLRKQEQTYTQKTDPKNYELKLEFPWNDQLSPDHKSDKDYNRGLRGRGKTDRHLINPKDYELDLEFPWNNQLIPKKDEGLTVKPINRRTNLGLSYPYPLNRNRNNNFNRRSNNDLYNNNNLLKSLGGNQRDISYSKRFDGNLKEEQSLRVLPITRRGRDNNAEINSFEADSSSITFPLDRRPHLRLGNQNNVYSRRAYGPMATTTSRSKVARVRTYNDTIIFPSQ